MMKHSKILFATATIILFVACFTSCKKHDIDPANKDRKCLIQTLAASTGEVDHFLYNSEGKPLVLTFNDRTITYSYSGNTIITTQFLGQNFFSRTTVTVNSAGLAIMVKNQGSVATNWDSTSYEYNGEELIKSTLFRPYSPPQITTYNWLDHNMVSSTVNGTTASYTYYTDKPIQAGDYFSLLGLFNGYEYIRNKNLLRSADITPFNYEFDSDGRISSLSVGSGSNQLIINYAYDCN
jgi:hypothetical protein